MGSGRAKKHLKSPMQEDGQTPPTEEEYAQMEHFKQFVVKNEDGVDITFENNQIVLILPHAFDPEETHELSTYWAARIKDIRSSKFPGGVNSVWARVQWFYSGKDVSDVIKSFDPKAVGRFERVYSDHRDFVQSAAFEMAIPMYKLNEDDHEQMFIPRNAFYRRYTFEYRARNLQPKPGLTTCICMTPYNPNDTDPKSVIHFCPRPACRRGFHHRCLLHRNSKESSAKHTLSVKIPSPVLSEGDTIRVTRTARKHAAPARRSSTRKATKDKVVVSLTPRALRLLGCSPDTDDTLDLDALIPFTSQRGRSKKLSLDSVLASIPSDLLIIATQPLVRGGAFINGGIAGNIGMVTKARRLVYTALQMGGGQGAVFEWEDSVFGEDREVVGVGMENAVVHVDFGDGVEGKDLTPFVCPNCKSAI